MLNQNERVSPQELYTNPVEDVAASIQSVTATDNNMQDAPAVEPVTAPDMPEPVSAPEVPATTEAPVVAPKPEAFDFDSQISALEEEFGLTKKAEEPKKGLDKEPAGDDGSEPDIGKEAEERLERDEKMITIIRDLDQANRNSLKKVSELEVQVDNLTTQAELYKKQAYGYYEELRANEFDRSKFAVEDEARNFVHYFNEYKRDSENVQAKNGALREAIGIVNKITGRDLSNYLMDYFTMGTTDMSAIPGGTNIQAPNFNVGPNRAKSEDDRKLDAMSKTFENL